MQLGPLSANQNSKNLSMKDSVVTARCGSVLWHGKNESKDYEEYLVVKVPLYLILRSRSPLILMVPSGASAS